MSLAWCFRTLKLTVGFRVCANMKRFLSPRLSLILAAALTLSSSAANTGAAEVPKLQPLIFPSSVKPGSRVSAVCLTTSGGSSVTLSWLKDGKDIGALGNVFVDTKRGLSTILIELVDISNAGNYTCIAKNRAGFDSVTATLDVQGKLGKKLVLNLKPERLPYFIFNI